MRFITLLVQRYREAPELGWGELQVLDQPHDSVLAHRVDSRRHRTIAVHNLGPEACQVLRLLRSPKAPAWSTSSATASSYWTIVGRVELNVDGYGYHWFRVSPPDDRRLA